MSREKKIGSCKICGTHGQLSFEHVPPEAAFNNGRYYYTAQMEKIIKLGDEDFDILTLKDKKHTKKKQGGIGFHTLCISCNNNTGSWYGSSFVDWIYQSMAILLKANKNPTLYYPTFIYPLRIIKQIVTMFFSLQSDSFRQIHPDLVRFILNKEDKFLNSKIKIYCYYNISGSHRYLSDIVVGNLDDGSATVVSEISFPPVGFVMVFDAKKPDHRLTDITHFAKYGYDEWTDHFQKFATLPTHLPFFPTDYRTKDEIKKGMEENKGKKHIG